MKKLILNESTLMNGVGLDKIFVLGTCNGAMLAQQLMFYTDLTIGGYFLHRTMSVISMDMDVEGESRRANKNDV